MGWGHRPLTEIWRLRQKHATLSALQINGTQNNTARRLAAGPGFGTSGSRAKSPMGEGFQKNTGRNRRSDPARRGRVRIAKMVYRSLTLPLGTVIADWTCTRKREKKLIGKILSRRRCLRQQSRATTPPLGKIRYQENSVARKQECQKTTKSKLSHDGSQWKACSCQNIARRSPFCILVLISSSSVLSRLSREEETHEVDMPHQKS